MVFGAKMDFLAPPNQLFPILQNLFFAIFGFSTPKYIKKTTRRKNLCLTSRPNGYIIKEHPM